MQHLISVEKNGNASRCRKFAGITPTKGTNIISNAKLNVFFRVVGLIFLCDRFIRTPAPSKEQKQSPSITISITKKSTF